MRLSSNHAMTMVACLLTMGGLAIHSATLAAAGRGESGGDGATTLDARFDTSFAVEYSYSCTSGGCHERDAVLMEEYAASFMTHTMVKCDACHGTHTAAEVGEAKPNLTGYYPGIGSTGYLVGHDRCIACHMEAFESTEHQNKTADCVDCHAPHSFAARRFSKTP